MTTFRVETRALRRALALIMTVWAVVAAGRAHADGLPRVTAHTRLDFAVYKGDRFVVEVQATGEDLEAKWLSTRQTVCRALVCEIDTAGWGLGTHRMTFVVFNAHGSLFLRFNVRVLAAPAGYKPGKVEPELQQAGEGIEAVSADDLTVRSIVGRGYSYHQSKVQVVGPLPRALDWEERLRTQPGATLAVGREGEAHVIGGETMVSLAKSESGRRALILRSGALRSRQLAAAEPRWSVVVPGLAQVDTDAQGDVLVERLGGDVPVVAVTVLRGNARVFAPAARDDAGVTGAGRSIGVPAGAEVLIRAGDDAPLRATAPDARRVGLRVRETTPLYMPGLAIAEQAPGSSILGERQPKGWDAALALATEAAAARDWLVVIEALQPFDDEAQSSYEASLALGEAYAGIHQHEVALRYLRGASRLDRGASRPHFLAALSHLAERQWRRALKALRDADDRGFGNEQLLYYYMGVAATYAKDPVQARSHFEYSLWDPRDERLADSARRFLRKADDDGWIDVALAAGLTYDSNPLRLSDSARKTPPGGIEAGKDAGAGWLASGRLALWPFRSGGGGIGFILEAERLGWLEPELSPLTLTRQALGLETRLAFGGGDAAPAALTVLLAAKAETHGVGAKRANDAVETRLVLGSPWLWGAGVGVASRLNLDPLPGDDGFYDPIVGEAVGPGERSMRQLDYLFELRPLESGAWTLGLGVRAGGARFRHVAQRGEDFSDLAVRVDGGYEPGMRHRLGLGIARLARDWKESADGREDTRLTVGLGWTWRFTTSLSQRLDVGYEKQDSSRAATAYGRQTAAVRWQLDL